jgi:hypothetical protein
MNISTTSTGFALTGPLYPISSIEITDPAGNTKTLNMSLVTTSGMGAIVAGTGYTLALNGFWRNDYAFVDPNASPIDSIKNIVVINAWLNTTVANPKTSIVGNLYKGRDGLIKISLDNGETNPSALESIDFGTASLLADLNAGITVDSNYIYIVLAAEKMQLIGKCRIEIAVNNGARSQLFTGFINVIDTLL